MPFIIKMNFSDEEYSQLQKIAEERHITIQDHIRKVLFDKESIFCPEVAEQRALDLPADHGPFTLSDLYTPEEWCQISTGEAGVFGRKFFKYIESKKGELEFRGLSNRRAVYGRKRNM